MNTPTAYSGISALTSPPKATISDAGRDREHEDAVREHEPVAPVGELAGQEAVAGDDRRQAREVGVGGVRRQDQDRERGEPAGAQNRGPLAEDRAGPSATGSSASVGSASG